MPYQEAQPVKLIDLLLPEEPHQAGLSEAPEPSAFCLTGKSGLEVRNIPIVAAAYIAFAALGALVFALVNVSLFMLIPVLGALAGGSVAVYFLHKRYTPKTFVQLQQQYPEQTVVARPVRVEIAYHRFGEIPRKDLGGQKTRETLANSPRHYIQPPNARNLDDRPTSVQNS